MWLLALEALVALGMLVLIVWLTMSGTRGSDADPQKTLPGKANSDRGES